MLMLINYLVGHRFFPVHANACHAITQYFYHLLVLSMVPVSYFFLQSVCMKMAIWSQLLLQVK
jgi:hypothetical protein